MISIDRRLIQTGITHSAALLLGWGAWSFLASGKRAPGSGAEVPSVTRNHAGGAGTVDEILSLIAPEKPGSKMSAAEWKARNAAFRAEFPELVRTMPVPDDLEATLEAELKRWEKEDSPPSPRIAVMMYQWASADLPGLLKWLGDGKDGDGEDSPQGAAAAAFLGTVVEQLAKDKGVDAVLPIFNNRDQAFNAIYSSARVLGESGNLHLMSELKDKLVPDQWDQLKSFFGIQCPWENRSTLVEFALSENQPELLADFGRFQEEHSAGVASWILGMFRDESLDAGFREKLSGIDRLKDIALSSSALPMDQRIALMQKGVTAPPDQRVYDELAKTDVAKQLVEGRDWPYEFRHGNVDANEVLAALSKELSETNSKAPDALRMAVFQSLVEEDSARAVALLDGLPPSERAGIVLDAAKNQFFKVHPGEFLAALQQIPADDPKYWDARLDAWVRHGPENYQRLDEGYVDWVVDLPEGVDRDMALYSLALASAKKNPSLAASLRSQVKDEELKRRISKS
jgi:hypothetical protein